MARILTSPFGLPNPGRPGSPPVLGAPQDPMVLAGAALVPLTILLLLYPWILDTFDRREVERYRAAFGYAVGDLRTDRGYAYWGVTWVAPGGRAERAGLRRRDVVVGDGGSLLWAVHEASAGRRACLRVWNLDDERLGRTAERNVCFDGDS